MIEILSSILASDLLSVGSEVQRMLDNGVDSLHVDIMDAHFVPNLSFGPAMVSALKKAFPEPDSASRYKNRAAMPMI